MSAVAVGGDDISSDGLTGEAGPVKKASGARRGKMLVELSPWQNKQLDAFWERQARTTGSGACRFCSPVRSLGITTHHKSESEAAAPASAHQGVRNVRHREKLLKLATALLLFRTPDELEGPSPDCHGPVLPASCDPSHITLSPIASPPRHNFSPPQSASPRSSPRSSASLGSPGSTWGPWSGASRRSCAGTWPSAWCAAPLRPHVPLPHSRRIAICRPRNPC